MRKRAIVIHSGGMDSSICLALAIRRHFRPEEVLSLTFDYAHRHRHEIEYAKRICQEWGVDQKIVRIDGLQELTQNALTHSQIPIEARDDEPPNTLVMGRNGLFARLGAIHAAHIGADTLYMGVIEVESANSGYRDCSREYMDLQEKILRLDLANPLFRIVTPVVSMTKKETLDLAHDLGVLPFLLEHTLSCYEGIPRTGCGMCPACQLRNEGIQEFYRAHPTLSPASSLCPLSAT